MMDFVGSPWLQSLMWVSAAVFMVYLARLMGGVNLVWGLVATGVLLIGIRVGYKLMPFYKLGPSFEMARYVIGIIGVVILFIGIMRYTNVVLRPLFRMD